MKKYLGTILFSLLLLPGVVWGQTEATVSKTVTSYKGINNTSEDSKVIKKSSESNSLNVLLQVGLINVGYNPGEPDGVVGAKTTQAVRNLQKDLGIPSDGVFGPNTANALRMFSDRFPNQKVSEVKNVLAEDFANFKKELKQTKKTTTPKYAGVTKVQLPTTPKGVLTYVLSKNQPGTESQQSSSLVGALVAGLTKKPKTNTTGTQSGVYNVNAGGSTSSGSSGLNTNFEQSSAAANSRYTCVTTSEHTESCSLESPGSESNSSYYCRGANCEVLGLTNRPNESVETYMAPSDFTQGIDFSQQAAWGEPVAFDKKTGKATIYLRDHGADPRNGQRNVSVIFVDLIEPVYNQ